MATVASILGQSGFDVDDASGSVPAGSESATGSDGERTSGSTNDVSTATLSSGNVSGESSTVNPADAIPGTNDDDRGSNSGRRGSTRKRGADANANKRTRASKQDEEGEIYLDVLLQSLHSILARVMAAPELELSEMEAKALAVSIKRVTKYISKKVLSPQQEAIGALVVTLGAIYLPRYLIYSARTGGPVVDAENSKVHSVNVNIG